MRTPRVTSLRCSPTETEALGRRRGRTTPALFLALFLVPVNGIAQAGSTTTLTITIISPPSTSISYGTSTNYSFAAPVAAGTTICGPITVQPQGWQGVLSLQQVSGPQPNAFAIAGGVGGNLVVGGSVLTVAGTYSLIMSASP